MGIIDKLDKNKVYCNKCFIEEKITALDKSDTKDFVKPCGEHRGPGYHIRVWKENLNEWVAIQGTNYTRKSKKEIFLELSKEPKYCSNPECENHKDAVNTHKVIINNLMGLCHNCFIKRASEIGKINAEKIGKLGFCTNKDCKHKNKKVIIINANGFCQDCSNLKGQQIGKLNFCSNVECENHKDAPNPHKVIIKTTVGFCEECAKIQGKKNSEKIGKLGYCSNLECKNHFDKDGAQKVLIVNISGLCKECSFKSNSALGLRALEKIGTINYCSNPECKNHFGKDGAHKILIANVYGNCGECAKIQGKKNSEKIGKLGYCSNPECEHNIEFNKYAEKIMIKDVAGLCEECVGKNGLEAAKKIGKLGYCSNPECPDKNKQTIIVSVSGRCNLCSNIHKTFLDVKLQPCGHFSKSVWNNKEYVCWTCYQKEFNSQIIKSDIEDFVKIPNEKRSIIHEMKLCNIFLQLDEENKSLKLSKNYIKNSLLYTGNTFIRELGYKLNINYGNKTIFMNEKLQPCGHMSKSVLSNGEYVCWTCYIKSFENQTKEQNLILGKRIPTFLKQSDRNIIPGLKFEQYLVDKNIGWFVYVKYHENGKPLVVGKTGSLLVNSNGSDLSFDRSTNGGPARQLLLETNTNWNRETISILKFNTEQEAIIHEQYLQINYKIFGS